MRRLLRARPGPKIKRCDVAEGEIRPVSRVLARFRGALKEGGQGMGGMEEGKGKGDRRREPDGSGLIHNG